MKYKLVTERGKHTNQRYFRCRCEKCINSVGPLTKKLGKVWQGNYGESQKDFRKRVRDWHINS